MKIKNVGIGVMLLGVVSIAGAVSAADLERCNSGSVVTVNDRQFCFNPALTYVNSATISSVNTSLTVIGAAVGFGIENRGVDSNREEIQGCIAGVNGGGSNTDSTCGGNIVAHHKFIIRN